MRISKYDDTLNNREWLYNEYCVKGKSALQISIELGCWQLSVQTALKKHQIIPRTKGESKRLAKELRMNNIIEQIMALHQANEITRHNLKILLKEL